MHSWRWFDQWISSSGRGEESYLFFYEIAGRSPGEPVGKIEDAPILNPRWEMQGHPVFPPWFVDGVCRAMCVACVHLGASPYLPGSPG